MKQILAVQQNTGAVTRISTVEPVRCCTPCTRVLDQQLTQALQVYAECIEHIDFGVGHFVPMCRSVKWEVLLLTLAREERRDSCFDDMEDVEENGTLKYQPIK